MQRAGVDDFDAVFRELFVPAYHLAYRVLRVEQDAQDAAAEALARTLADWKRVAALPHRRGWVLRVTSNVAIDMLRRRRTAGGDEVADALARALSGDGRDDAAGVELRLSLRAALAELPRRQLEVVVLRYLAGIPENDVAATLGLRPGSVKTHASRGLSRLRELLSEPDLMEAQGAY